jgi:tripartite-type tricarboxylate transporter receptor subunit TctC
MRHSLKFLFIAWLLLSWPALSPPAMAEYPDKPVRIICVYPAGGGIDIVMRSVAQKLSQAWGHPVLVENLAGAGTTIGTAAVAKASPDGYTLLATDVSFSIAASLYEKLPYDPAKDLAPISLFATVSQALVVTPSFPVHSMQELIAYAKANPDKVLYATSGAGTPPHLTWARLNKLAGINITAVPYKGASASLIDVVAGREQIYSGATGTIVAYVKAGRLRPLAILDKHRTKVLPDVPTIAEAGLPNLEVNAWYGLFAPAGTPRDIIDRVNKELAKSLTDKDVQKTLALLGDEPLFGIGPDEFTKFLKSDFVKWREAVAIAGQKIK